MTPEDIERLWRHNRVTSIAQELFVRLGFPEQRAFELAERFVAESIRRYPFDDKSTYWMGFKDDFY